MTIHRQRPLLFTAVVSYTLFAVAIAVGVLADWPDTTLGGIMLAITAVMSSIYGGWLGRNKLTRR